MNVHRTGTKVFLEPRSEEGGYNTLMIHLVGTYHELQHTARPRGVLSDKVQEGRRDLQAYLRELATRINPKLIGEEFSQQGLDGLKAKSTVKLVADELGIEHRFCDPNTAERVKLGLPHPYLDHCDKSEKPRLDRIREIYWLETLSDMINHDILFICGADHVSSFAQLLLEEGITAQIEDEYFGQAIYNRTNKGNNGDTFT